MAPATPMVKPGERAPQSGEYYCYICAQIGETSTCRVEGGQMLVECPRCLERKVPEWDMTWKPVGERPGAGPAKTSPWPGSLGRSH